MRLPGESVEETIAKVLRYHPIEFEERIPTMGRPLVIENACPGWQPRYWGPRDLYPAEPPGYKEGGVRFPAVPCSLEDQARVLIESAKAGAAAAHIHPRDPSDCLGRVSAEMTAQLYGMVFQEVDVVSLNHTFEMGREEPIRPDYIRGTREFLKLGKGNKYCQAAVMLWPPSNSYPSGYEEIAREAVRFFEENEIKPIHKLRSAYHVRQLKRALIDTGVLTKKPYLLVHDMGHPFGWPLDIEPWWPIDLVTSIQQTKVRIPDSIIGVFPGGRNWLPITVMAILAGVDLVRTGIEDCFWMYPHRDEVIESNVEMVKKVVTIANILGRPVANAEETRQLFGLKLTSKTR